MYWDLPGEGNTDVTLAAAFDRARTKGIRYMVVASTSGRTAKAVLKLAAENPGVNLVVVTHHVGFRSPGHREMPVELVESLRAAGIDVLTTTEAIAVGGTGKGADTALVLRPAHAKEFFNTEILEVICKPRNVR